MKNILNLATNLDVPNKEVIDAIEKLGFEVNIEHHRPHGWRGPENNGGHTIVAIDKPSARIAENFALVSGISCVGVSRCSEKDPYDKKVGVRYALIRAVEQAAKVF